VYFVNKNNQRVLFDSRYASLEPSSNVIKGPHEYSQIINETIFKQLILENKCFEESIQREEIIIVFYCHNTDEIKNYIKSRFSNINFLDRFLGEEFTLTYNDLFLEKGDKLFFLVVFDLMNSLITWILGKPFLKKYFFSYNYNKKTNSVIRPNNLYYYWNIEFTQVYFVNKNNQRMLFNSRIASLEPSSNVIKGPHEYSQIINETIFKQLILEKKCFEESIKREEIIIVFYCHNTDEIKNYIKSRFSNINFLDRFLGEEFTLTYNDLFLEKGDKLYFLVTFDLLNSLITWILGKPFLKKYFFSYNYNQKVLAYYGNNKNTGEEISDNQNNNQWVLIIITIFLIVIFCSVGFLLAKYIYKNKKKKDATELDEDSQYQGIQPINEGEGLNN
jgi:predicted permease